jgi:hypothetical protein
MKLVSGQFRFHYCKRCVDISCLPYIAIRSLSLCEYFRNTFHPFSLTAITGSNDWYLCSNLHQEVTLFVSPSGGRSSQATKSCIYQHNELGESNSLSVGHSKSIRVTGTSNRKYAM